MTAGISGARQLVNIMIGCSTEIWLRWARQQHCLTDAANAVCCCCRYASHMLVPPAMARAAAKAALDAGTDPDEITSSIGSFKCGPACFHLLHSRELQAAGPAQY